MLYTALPLTNSVLSTWHVLLSVQLFGAWLPVLALEMNGGGPDPTPADPGRQRLLKILRTYRAHAPLANLVRPLRLSMRLEGFKFFSSR